ncbi:MAG: cysteine--tRNA ligase [Alphaproteobacteria bacterium]
MNNHLTLKIYNTLARQKEIFEPLDPDNVRLYVCGPTVYNRAHIGNARPYTIFDVWVRLLRLVYPKVLYVRNITDIDDKIITSARQNQESIEALTQRTTGYFHEDMAKLFILSPDAEPRATAFVEEMIHLIQRLIHQGYAYEDQGHLLFHVRAFKSYGALSGASVEAMQAGARVDVAPYKKDPLDFVLWKPSPREPDFPGWESPWGYGRPGWHIECSAMSSHYLGPVFDIHGGGQDLMFPHHENEVAQSCAAHGTEVLARYWMHNGILTVEGEKMSKSLGNIVTVSQVLEAYPAEVARWVLLGTHYRQPLDWTEAALSQSSKSLDRLYGALRCLPEDAFVAASEAQSLPEADILQALADDLNTPLAFHHLHALASHVYKSTSTDEKVVFAKKLLASGRWMGFFNQSVQSWFQSSRGEQDPLSATFVEEIESKIQQRLEAKQAKAFDRADALRKELLAKGIALEDTPKGTQWKRI